MHFIYIFLLSEFKLRVKLYSELLYLPSYYKLKTGRDGKSDSEFYMNIDWQKDADKQVFAFAKAVKSKQMRKIEIENFKSEENKDILNYLINNCPEKLRIFRFDSNDKGYCSVDYYLEGIQKVTLLRDIRYY